MKGQGDSFISEWELNKQNRWRDALQACCDLPEAFRACITMTECGNYCYEVKPNQYTTFCALLIMSGAIEVENQKPFNETYWVTKTADPQGNLFIANKERCNPHALLAHLRN